jgi:hypothetical protein
VFDTTTGGIEDIVTTVLEVMEPPDRYTVPVTGNGCMESAPFTTG